MEKSSASPYEQSQDPTLKCAQNGDNNITSPQARNVSIGDASFNDGPSYGPVLGNSSSYPALGDKNSDKSKGFLRQRFKRQRSAKYTVLHWTRFMDGETKNNVVAFMGEFIGTTMFLFFAFAGTQLANVQTSDTSIQIVEGQTESFNAGTLFYISASFGFSLMVNAWVFFRISGGLFNPAVTLAAVLVGAIGPLRAGLLFVAQMAGACFAAYLVQVMFPTPFKVQTTLQYGTTITQGIFIEAMCTAMLVFTIIMLAVEKHRATFMAPVAIGLALFISEMVSVYYTGGSLNPARSFGPAAVQHNFMDSHWIYWLGPLIGTLFAVSTYKIFKSLEYELANPGQDGDRENDPAQNPHHHLARIAARRKAEVEEIRNVEQAGALMKNNQASHKSSVLSKWGVIGMAVDGVRHGDETHVQRVRNNSQDLEANWPVSREVGSVSSEMTAGFSPKVGKKASISDTFTTLVSTQSSTTSQAQKREG